MIFIDSGYLIALPIVRDDLHSRALHWAHATRDYLLVTEYVVWETVNHLSALADRPKAHELVTHFVSDPACEFVRATPILFDAGMALHRARADKTWSLTDCISFHLMEERTGNRGRAGVRRAFRTSRFCRVTAS